MVVIFASCPRKSKFAWRTKFTEDRALLSIELDGSLPTELIGAWRFCPGAAGCRVAEGADGDRRGGRCLDDGGVACRVRGRCRGGQGVEPMVAEWPTPGDEGAYV